MKRVLSTLKEKWPEYLLEMLVLFIGIYCAFAVENWNENRLEKQHEERVITALHNEFDENLKDLREVIVRLDSQRQFQVKLLEAFSNSSNLSEYKLDKLINKSFGYITWNPSSYVLNDLKNSGQISKLSDHNLQLLLFAWERYYENLLETQITTYNSTENFLEYIRKKGSLRNMDYVGDSSLSKTKFGFSNLKLLEQLEFENIVDDKLATANSLYRDYNKTIPEIEKILEATKP